LEKIGKGNARGERHYFILKGEVFRSREGGIGSTTRKRWKGGKKGGRGTM